MIKLTTHNEQRIYLNPYNIEAVTPFSGTTQIQLRSGRSYTVCESAEIVIRLMKEATALTSLI